MEKLKICLVSLTFAPDSQDGAAKFFTGIYNYMKKQVYLLEYVEHIHIDRVSSETAYILLKVLILIYNKKYGIPLCRYKKWGFGDDFRQQC